MGIHDNKSQVFSVVPSLKEVETRWIDKQYAEEFQLVALLVQETQYIFPWKHCSFKTFQTLVHRAGVHCPSPFWSVWNILTFCKLPVTKTCYQPIVKYVSCLNIVWTGEILQLAFRQLIIKDSDEIRNLYLNGDYNWWQWRQLLPKRIEVEVSVVPTYLWLQLMTMMTTVTQGKYIEVEVSVVPTYLSTCARCPLATDLTYTVSLWNTALPPFSFPLPLPAMSRQHMNI